MSCAHTLAGPWGASKRAHSVGARCELLVAAAVSHRVSAAGIWCKQPQ